MAHCDRTKTALKFWLHPLLALGPSEGGHPPTASPHKPPPPFLLAFLPPLYPSALHETQGSSLDVEMWAQAWSKSGEMRVTLKGLLWNL